MSKTNSKEILHSVLIDKEDLKRFIDVANSMDELHDMVFQGYIDTVAEKREAWAEHLYCEFVLAWMQLCARQIVVLHNIQEDKEK